MSLLPNFIGKLCMLQLYLPTQWSLFTFPYIYIYMSVGREGGREGEGEGGGRYKGNFKIEVVLTYPETLMSGFAAG